MMNKNTINSFYYKIIIKNVLNDLIKNFIKNFNTFKKIYRENIYQLKI